MSTGPAFPHPEDLDAWRRWQRSRQPLARRVRAALTERGADSALDPTPAAWLVLPDGPVRTLVALESSGPTQRAALLEPALALSPEERGRTALLLPDQHVPAEWSPIHRARPVSSGARLPERLADLEQVLAVGEYLGRGALAVRWARQVGARVLVAQHGLLAHQVPPLPADCTLLAFTDQDAQWWRAGRDDVRTVTTGSQLLWSAAQQGAARMSASGHDDAAPSGASARPADPGVFLGQLHGAELPRREFAAAALEYCRATGAVYRPHPAETDRLSRAQHALWERRGVRIDRSGRPLTAATGPVAAVFSTGILEAAYAGRTAHAVHPDPPEWLVDFWSRYGMSRWTPGAAVVEPTVPPQQPQQAPARAVAALLTA